MFWTFNMSLDILSTVWATFPNIGRIFVQFSGHSDTKAPAVFLRVSYQPTHLTSDKWGPCSAITRELLLKGKDQYS
jgi:hypothetical protein